MKAATAVSAANRRLSVMVTLRGVLAIFHRYPRRFLRIAALPFALILSLGMSAAFAFPALYMVYTPAEVALGVAGFALVLLLPLAALNVVLARTILVTSGANKLWLLGRRILICFGYSASILVAACVLVMAAVTAFFASAIDINIADQDSSAWDILLVASILGFFALLYVLARLSLVFPAISLDQRLGLVGSWRLSKGNGARLCLAYLTVFVTISLLALAGTYLLDQAAAFTLWLYQNAIPAEHHYWPGRVMKSLPVFAVTAAISCIGAGLLTGVSATAYAQLTGWGQPRQEVLERFD